MNHRIKKHSYLTVGVLFMYFSICAQQSAVYTNELASYHKALELYQNKQFLASQTLFSKVKDEIDDETIDAECSYYIANCAVWLNQRGADQLMEDFVTTYPTSIKKNAAYLDVANYYFDSGKYAYARRWYDRADASNLGKKELEKLYFNKGYSYFKIQRFNQARKYFNRVQESKTYGGKAKYYLGFIAYQGDNYNQATRLFDEVKDLGKYNKSLSYFQSHMKFKEGNFQEAIDEGLPKLATSKPSEKSELNKIIGESYFNLEKYKEAIPYLKGYKGRKGKWNNTDYYQLGYALYKQKSYPEAITEFNKIIGGKNATAQNAYYHLAESYLQSGQKQQALHAFKNASEMNFNPVIKEDAFYNYAKLGYEIGNAYQSASVVLQEYLRIYPETKNRTEIQELLISSFITAKNYKEAIRIIDLTPDFRNDQVLQKVTFYRGLELFNEGDFVQSSLYFDKSLQHREDPYFTAKALYWGAESNYIQQLYREALIGFKQFKKVKEAVNFEEYLHLDYQIGYSYFKLKRYDQAASYFKTYVKKEYKGNDARAGDTYLRLADSYFILRNYKEAKKVYNKAIDNDGQYADYAHYQKAIIYGFLKKNNQKILYLTLFLEHYTTSIYWDDALFALADTYVAENRPDLGLKAYNRLVTEKPKSSYVPKALLKKGLVNYNNDQNEEALETFKKIAATYPNSDEAIQAVNTARLIYVDLDRTAEYADWVKELSFIKVSDTDLDNTAYEAAEKQLVGTDIPVAIKSLDNYLIAFPEGKHALKSHFQLAKLFTANKQEKKAIPHFEYVLQKDRTEYTEESLVKLSELYLANKSYTQAISVLERLEKEGDFPQNIVYAQSNLMKAHYEMVNYNKTIAYADKVLANPKIQDDIKGDATIFTARAALQIGDMPRAQEAYAAIEKIAKGILGAEALYYRAYFENAAGDYKGSNESIQQLATNYSGYARFGAKGLLLMAKNFYSLEDAYQATYILESVIKNFETYPEIVKEAQAELETIKKQEAKTNSSIQIEQ